jgi:eukaryotic-like serine/threonine-protein kinase
MTFLSDGAVARLRAAADTPDLTGTRYRLIDKLGEGGMGAVYRVEDTLLGRQVALKVINIIDAEGELSRRLLREARIIAQLEHPGIVPVHDSGILRDECVFYTMKLVQGRHLDQHARDLPAITERLRVFQKICEPIAFAHARGVLHRDLKPENVMIGPFGEVLVMDWGISKLLMADADAPSAIEVRDRISHTRTDSAELDLAQDESIEINTAHGAVIGTPGYMAPEQARGEAVDERSDIYALGAILQFLLRIENVGNTGSGVDDHGPGQGLHNRRILQAIATRAMSEKPAERYPSVRDLMADVEHYLDGLPVSAYPENIFGRSWRWISKNRVWILLVLAYIAMRTLLILFRQR